MRGVKNMDAGVSSLTNVPRGRLIFNIDKCACVFSVFA